ncbi:MAG: excinuclease ABC subunit UvrA [Myxococcales bacterium]|nr:excinuclease ABC subunit UvrA [Myxococcales bacterium]
MIEIRGAREHNLRGIDLDLPRDQLIVFTGVSGSGKSSLAFDTLYAEGQRRYVESLSAYARQFLGQLERPKVDRIRGLSPTIAIAQHTTVGSPRSTVGTTTEVYDYLRLLYARVGVTHCPSCGRRTEKATADQIVAAIGERPEGSRWLLLAPLARQKKGSFEAELAALAVQGYVRLRIDGQIVETAQGGAPTSLDKNKRHDVDVVIDRLVVKPGGASRLRDSVEAALRLGDGQLELAPADGSPGDRYSVHRMCLDCGVGLPDLSPALFSFNSPTGACPTCSGIGTRQEVDQGAVIPDPSLSLLAGCIAPWSGTESQSRWFVGILKGLSAKYGVDLEAPWQSLAAEHQHVVLNGTGGALLDVPFETKTGVTVIPMPFEGVVSALERQRVEPTGESEDGTRGYLREVPCRDCGGHRLRAEARAVRVGAFALPDLVGLPLGALRAAIDGLALTGNAAQIAAEILRELRARIGFLVDVGLDYLTLRRNTATLSGGEAQRIRLASQVGSELSGVLYVLDEPSIGLHPRDTGRLLRTLRTLRDLGNTVLVVEHDRDTIEAADFIVDFGPGAGTHGGHLVAQGNLDAIKASSESLTGAFLSGRRRLPVRVSFRTATGELRVRGPRANNLKGEDVTIPLGVFTVVTGVSGAGKSSLVNAILYPALARRLNRASIPVAAHDGVDGMDALERVVAIDQRPIGRSPRSNPATYTKLFDTIRKVYAETREARVLGFDAGRFSFNVKGGRCEACEGVGVVKIEMHFLSDVYVTCEACRGRRFNEGTLQVRYRDLTIDQVLGLTVEEALDVFSAHPALRRALELLRDVGLDYMQLGQPGHTLSGGEAQRIKLSRELARPGNPRGRGRGTLYIMDEPSTGLHFADVERLLGVVQRLVDAGNTVVMIEHDLDLIRAADWVIDLGPEGGDAGGHVVVAGTPEHVMAHEASHTGRALRGVRD